eukprot:6665308-Pyramimonas_sp.AAC.1
MLERYQIACFQEIHGSDADLTIIRDELRTGMLYGSFIEGSAASGVVTYVSSELRECFREAQERVVIEGRALLVTRTGDAGDLAIERAHAEHL